MINPEQIDKTGGTITYGYSLNCSNQNLVVKAIVSDADTGWLTVTGDMSQSGTIEIRATANNGNTRNSTIGIYIVNNSTSETASTCNQKYIAISQAGEGGGSGGECKYDVTYTTPTCGEDFTITWTKTEPSPTPPGPTPGCDGSIVIQGSSSIDCETMSVQLTAETTVQCDAKGDYTREKGTPYPAAGSNGQPVKIGTVSGCEGSWTFSDGGEILSNITVSGSDIKAIVKPNTTGSPRYKNITGTCNGCSNPFEIWQDGGSSTCEGITIQGSSTVTCDTMSVPLTATTNNQ